MEESVAVFHLHNDHAQVDGLPRQGLYNALAECCAGGVRIIAGDMNMAFWGLIPEFAARGEELHRMAKPAERNITTDQWQGDAMGI
jgi:hypothetical protein